MAPAYTFIGTTDEVTTCGCCGRSDLKGTVVLKDADSNFVFFGSVCGAKAQGWTVKDFNTAAKTAQKAREQAIRQRDAQIRWAVQQHPDVVAAAAAIPMAGSGKTFAERLPFINARRAVEDRIRAEIEASIGG
jgi:hypothetical protein